MKIGTLIDSLICEGAKETALVIELSHRAAAEMKYVRQSLELTQSQMANILGVGLATIQQAERPTERPCVHQVGRTYLSYVCLFKNARAAV